MQHTTWRSKRGRDGEEDKTGQLLLFAATQTDQRENVPTHPEKNEVMPRNGGLTETFRPSDLFDELEEEVIPGDAQNCDDSQATEDYSGLPGPSAQQKIMFPLQNPTFKQRFDGATQEEAIEIGSNDDEEGDEDDLFHNAAEAGSPHALARPGGSVAFPLANFLTRHRQQAPSLKVPGQAKIQPTTVNKNRSTSHTASGDPSAVGYKSLTSTSISPVQAVGHCEFVELADNDIDNEVDGDDDTDEYDIGDDYDDPELAAAIKASLKDQQCRKREILSRRVNTEGKLLAPQQQQLVRGKVDFASYDWASQGKLGTKIIPAFRKECCRQLLSDYSTLDAFRPFIHHKSMKKLQASSDEVFNSKSFPTVPSSLPDVDVVVGPDEEEELLGDMQGDPTSKLRLRNYQEEGVRFLLGHFHRGLSCILGDDMGLGKTVQLSFFLGVLHRLYGISGPHLIVAPLSTLSGWSRELARWAPRLEVIKLHGKVDARYWVKKQCKKKPLVVITTNATFIQEEKFMKSLNWVVHMVDEAHTLKSDGTRLSTLCHKMTSAFRVAITGTPIQNGAVELWNIMAFLYPFLCRGAAKSGEEFEDVAQGGREDTGRALRAETTGRASTLLDCIMLRRLKTVVEKNLPPKRALPLVALESTKVQSHMLRMWRSRILEAQSTELRQMFHDERKIANHPFTVKLLADEERGSINDFDALGNSPGVQRLIRNGIHISEEDLITPSAKMVRLDSLCKELKEQGHRALIFSNYTSQLDLLEGFCRLRDYTYERLDGSSSRVDREVSMRRFNPAGSGVFLFLITTTAGGVGITLTGADTVILYDSHYNPQMDRQAEDRAYRIGQTRPVSVYRFYVKGTIEEQIVQRAHAKAVLGDFIVDKKSADLSAGKSNTDFDESKFFSAKNLRNMMQTNSEMNSQKQSHHEVVDGELNSKEEEPPPNSSSHSEKAEKIALNLWEARQAYLEAKEERKGTYVMKATGGMTGRTFPAQERCFYCDETIDPETRSLKPKEGGVFSCVTCAKEYHCHCVKEMNGGTFPKFVGSTWSCPRHECSTCGRDPSSDGGMFYCILCLKAFCIDCLDPKLFELHPVHKTHFVHISRNYGGMEAEGMPIKKGVYYLLCQDCEAGGDSASNVGQSCEFIPSDSEDEDAPAGLSQKRRKGHTGRSSSKHFLITADTPARLPLLEGATTNRGKYMSTVDTAAAAGSLVGNDAPQNSLMDLSRKAPLSSRRTLDAPRPPTLNLIDDDE